MFQLSGFYCKFKQLWYQSRPVSSNTVAPPKLPFKRPQIPSNRDHKALHTDVLIS